MDMKFQQEKFDDEKWYDSIVAGEDRCGTYDFCAFCNKEDAYPCANAASRALAAECEELEASAIEEAPKKKNFTRIATIRIRVGE